MTDNQYLEAALAALSKQKLDPEGAFTTVEWGEIFGKGSAATRKRIRTLLLEGVLEKTEKDVLSIMDDKTYRTVAFRLVGK